MNTNTHTPQRLAAPAPEPREEEVTVPATAADLEREGRLDLICHEWAAWARTRRLYVRNSAPASLLGRLRSSGVQRVQTGGRDAACSAELMAFHLAYLAQPSEALDRRVFELHYYFRVSNVKAAAAEMKIGRQHWYTLIRDFRTRVWRDSREIYELNMAAKHDLRSIVESK